MGGGVSVQSGLGRLEGTDGDRLEAATQCRPWLSTGLNVVPIPPTSPTAQQFWDKISRRRQYIERYCRSLASTWFPCTPPNITHSPPAARFQQLCDEYLSLNICRWVLDMFWHPIFWNPLQPSWYNYDFWGQYFCTLCKRCQAHIRMTSRCPGFSLQCPILFSVGLCKSVGLLCIF